MEDKMFMNIHEPILVFSLWVTFLQVIEIERRDKGGEKEER